MTTPAEPAPAVVLPPDVWAGWHDDALLDLRINQLGVTIEGSALEDRIALLQTELEGRGLASFVPHFWLSAEWFSPDGVPGVAIPFYLAHPRLERLERAQMLEVEGGTPEWCMKILRHEAGHAIDNAYKLRLRRRRQQLFGPSYMQYPNYYTPKPYSKSFVLHLDSWYAQSHPDEDFAETFAVWLNPGSDWRTRYADWPALKKLEYMDALMAELSGKPMLVNARRRLEPLHKLRKTLRAHYERKRRHYGVEHPHFYDRDLRRLFSDGPEHTANIKAARFIARVRRDVRRMVSEWTGEYQYTIDQVLESMLKRCTELNLRLMRSEDSTKSDFLVMLTVQTMNYLHSGRHRVAL
ncbi:MAG TPA: putative zinc-binding metallopeptidase [Vicinamibacterales bacterium]|nr:putative zinc-binding metallopeptidase [Vicinamibacterales bacterium]